MQRIILHVDLDYFYAQVEELRNPELRGKPVAVCVFSGRSEFSGSVATCNYVAREFGVKAGLPIFVAKQRCNDLVLLSADREYYELVSDRVMDLLREFSDFFEQVSVDEAFLDVSGKCFGSIVEARGLALRIKSRLFEEEGLTCSIGVGPNKLIAKMACESKKPNGLMVVSGDEVKDFLCSKKLGELPGVGEKTIQVLKENGITKIVELANAPIEKLKELFGEKKGELLHNKALGLDDSPVKEKQRQQFSRIVTLKEFVSSADGVLDVAPFLVKELILKLSEKNLFFRTVSVVFVSSDFKTFSRSKTIESGVYNEQQLKRIVEELVKGFFEDNEFVCRRFGVRVSNFVERDTQKKIFEF